MFQAVILCLIHGITRFHNVKPIIWGQLDAWGMARYVVLVKEVEEVNLDSGGGRRRVDVQRRDNATSHARKHDNMVLGGKSRVAVWIVTNRGAGGPFRPHNLDSKSECPVIDVLRDKHPDFLVLLTRTLMPIVTLPTCSTPCQCTAMRNVLQKQLHISLAALGPVVLKPRC